MVEKILGWVKSLTEIGLAFIALGVVLQILFGAAVPFIGLDVIGSVVAVVKELGSEGLVGLVAIWVLWGIYSK
jgi:hypothetical protein|tara:strand:- start:231 stop:449 length:219 start_codon:yes stop_codon:yes gene_type:complete